MPGLLGGDPRFVDVAGPTGRGGVLTSVAVLVSQGQSTAGFRRRFPSQKFPQSPRRYLLLSSVRSALRIPQKYL